jgi:hypothetical protein
MNLDKTPDFLKKVALEKRKRYQTYKALDYLLSMTNTTDFFTQDAYYIYQMAFFLTKYSPNKKVTIREFFAAYFLEPNSNVYSQLEKLSSFNFVYENTIANFYKMVKQEEERKKSVLTLIKKVFSFIFYLGYNKKQKKKRLVLEVDLRFMLFKARQNAIYRFKTPVISTEVLFITMMEHDKVNGGDLMESLFDTKLEWYLFRFKLIQSIHVQELAIRNKVSINQQYFAYLLKTQLSDIQFNSLIEKKDSLNTGVAIFRDLLVQEILKTNIFASLKKETYLSIRSHKNKRKYSTWKKVTATKSLDKLEVEPNQKL